MVKSLMRPQECSPETIAERCPTHYCPPFPRSDDALTCEVASAVATPSGGTRFQPDSLFLLPTSFQQCRPIGNKCQDEFDGRRLRPEPRPERRKDAGGSLMSGDYLLQLESEEASELEKWLILRLFV